MPQIKGTKPVSKKPEPKPGPKPEKKEAPKDMVAFTPYQLMDALDDKAIMAELEGKVLDTWVYNFAMQGVDTWGLAKNGVDQCCIELEKQGNAIREVALDYKVDEEDKEYMFFTAFAERVVIAKDGSEKKLARASGTKRQWRKFKKRSGDIVEDPFFFEKGSQKALRNARLRLIPETVKVKLIAMAKKLKGRVATVQRPSYSNTTPASDKQKKLIWILGKKLEIYDSADKNDEQLKDFKAFLLKKCNINVKHFSKLTMGGASIIIDQLQGLVENSNKVPTIEVEE